MPANYTLVLEMLEYIASFELMSLIDLENILKIKLEFTVENTEIVMGIIEPLGEGIMCMIITLTSLLIIKICQKQPYFKEFLEKKR